MRLGNYPCAIAPGTRTAGIYNKGEALERHRHRFEFNNAYRAQMEQAGFIISATSPDGSLVEIVELRDHPFMLATQAHPELSSRPLHPHPLFMGFVEAMVARKR